MRRVLPAAVVVAAWMAVPSSADAYGPRVRKACANDYMDNCHLHRLGTPELRACMRKAGPKLTPQCVDALVAEGEVSAKEVAQRRASATGK
ncbi:MAG: hypothetical protein AB7S70_15000 [Hyphomicrobium sp.]|uniref:hypothetical protein n=1 Tax=Hyphomicrobium sp. TaxID=82 RepID=UPI003D11A741